MTHRTTGIAIGATALILLLGVAITVIIRGGGSGGMSAALDVVPEDTVRFSFFDREAFAERIDMEDVDSDSSESEVEDYLHATQQAPGSTPFLPYLKVMQDEGAAFTELDIDWTLQGSRGPGEDISDFEVHRMSDDVDLEALGDELAELGADKSEVGGHPRFAFDLAETSEDGMLGDSGYPAVGMRDVTLVEDEHLMVVGSHPESVIDVLEGDAEPLAKNDRATVMLEEADDVELGILDLHDPVCVGDPGRLSPEQLEQLKPETEGMVTQTGSALLLGEDDDEVGASFVLSFDSSDDAEKDAVARARFLRDGRDLVTGNSFEEYVDDFEVEANASLVVVDADFKLPRTAVDMAVSRGGPVTCPL